MEINRETKSAIIYINDIENGEFNYNKIRGFRLERIFIPIEFKDDKLLLENIRPNLYMLGKKIGSIYYYNNEEE